MIEVRTIAITAPGKVEVMSLSTPPLCGREVLVKVHAVALCTLEQRIFSGEVRMPYPCTGGHELAGEIVGMGPLVDTQLWKTGDRAAVRLLYNCGECHQCRSGRTNMCEHSRHKPVRDGLLPGPGGLCDYIVVDSSQLFPIPESLPYEQACLTEPLACVVHSINRADISLADDVVVVGAGIMGQLHVRLSKMRGARVIVCEMDALRRKMALDGGADFVVDPLAQDASQTVFDILGGRGADVVFNTVAVPGALQQAFMMVGRAGKLIQYSSVHPDAPIQVSAQSLHEGQITLTGSISPTVEDFYTANRLLSAKLIDLSPFIQKTFPFNEAASAFGLATRKGSFRVIITD